VRKHIRLFVRARNRPESEKTLSSDGRLKSHVRRAEGALPEARIAAMTIGRPGSTVVTETWHVSPTPPSEYVEPAAVMWKR
jgi:hypothetical protein